MNFVKILPILVLLIFSRIPHSFALIDARLINVDTGKINALEGYLEAKANALLAGGFYGTPEDPQSASPYLTQYLPKQKRYTRDEIVKSALDKENKISSKNKHDFQFYNDTDPDFDIIDYINNEVDNSDYAPYAKSFLDAKNIEQAELIKSKIRSEITNRSILNNSGLSGYLWQLLSKLLSPISLVICFLTCLDVIHFPSKKRTIITIILASILSVISTETYLTATQITRTWGEGFFFGLLAGLFHSLICILLIKRFFKNKTDQRLKSNSNSSNKNYKSKTSNKNSDSSPSYNKLKNDLRLVEKYLKLMGYELLPYGISVAYAELVSGYSPAETSSHIALTTMALDVKETNDGRILIFYVTRAYEILHILKELKDKNEIHPTQWQNDTNALWRVVSLDKDQLDWVDTILSDPISGKERLAKSIINYK